MGDERAVESLIRVLEEEYDEDILSATAVALGKMRDVRAVEPLILKLRSRYSGAREGAAWALGRIGDARAVQPLIQTLDDIDVYVRKDVVWALGRIGDARAVEPLKQALKDGYSQVRREAVEALGKIRDVRAVNSLIRVVLNREEKVDVRMEAIRALEEMGDERALEPLNEVLDEEYFQTPEGRYNPDIRIDEQDIWDEESHVHEEMVEVIREAIRRIEEP